MTQPSQTTINDLKNIKNVLYPDDNEQYKDLVRVNHNLLKLTIYLLNSINVFFIIS